MTRHLCSGCGVYDPEGRCYFEVPDPEDEEGDTGIHLDELRRKYGSLGLAPTLGDPLRVGPLVLRTEPVSRLGHPASVPIAKDKAA